MALFKITKKNNCHTFKIRNSRALGGTSRVVLELKPFGISIRGLIGSEPWVGRSTGKMSRNSSGEPTCFIIEIVVGMGLTIVGSLPFAWTEI